MDIDAVEMEDLYLLTPLTERANRWFAHNVDEDSPRYGLAFVVEGRATRDAVVAGMRADGLAAA